MSPLSSAVRYIISHPSPPPPPPPPPLFNKNYLTDPIFLDSYVKCPTFLISRYRRVFSLRDFSRLLVLLIFKAWETSAVFLLSPLTGRRWGAFTSTCGSIPPATAYSKKKKKREKEEKGKRKKENIYVCLTIYACNIK